MKKILLVGGGTGGHILPLKNLSDTLLKQGHEVTLCVAEAPLDRRIVDQNFLTPKALAPQVCFLKTGKIRRYFSFQNFIDGFQILGAFFRARKILRTTKPDVIFFKGGFLCFPVLIAAKFLFSGFSGKMFLHESDSSISNLGKFLAQFCTNVFSNFGENPHYLFYSLPTTDLQKSSPQKTLPQLLIFGGSQGSTFINQLFEKNAPALCKKFHVTLVTGPQKDIAFTHQNLKKHDLLPVEEMSAAMDRADLIISRASASVFQFLEMKKKSLLIPLPSAARNHQFLNAEHLATQNLVRVLEENDKTHEKLLATIDEVLKDASFQKNLDQNAVHNRTEDIAREIVL